MGLSTIFLVLFIVMVFVLLGRRDARRARTETLAKRAERKRKDDDAVLISSILDDR